MSKPPQKTASPILRFAAVLGLTVLLAQPLLVLADDTTVTDANNGQNPAVQTTDAGSTNNVPVTTETTYSTSTPDSTNPSDATSTDSSVGDATSTPEDNQDTSNTSTNPSLTNTPTSTPESNITPCDGSASSTPDSSTDGSQNDSGSNQPCNSSSTTTDNSILPETDPASASSTDDSTTTIDLLNSNNLDATTTATSTANTGLNNILADADLNGATTTTGAVNIYANVLTVANTNLVNSQIEQINNNFNDLAADLYLNQPELSQGERTQDLVSPICASNGLTCQSITTFKLTNQNTANVDNNVAVSGNSGGNTDAAGDDVDKSSINTGDVNAVVNILNIVNTNAINSTWTIVTFNVFGNWQGDLVMPSQLYFSNLMSVGSADNSAISQVQSVILNVNNTNQSSINNNVVVQTDTGDNVIATVPDASGVGGGDVNNAAITTGTSTAETNVQNLTNVTLYNSSWFLGLINIMGTWSGNVYSLPSSVGANFGPNGFQFVSSSDPTAQAQMMDQLKPTNSTSTLNGTASPTNPGDSGPDNSSNQQNLSNNPDATTTPDGGTADTSADSPVDATSTSTTEVDLTNTNNATINNNVTINATSGQNAIMAQGGDANNDSITSGSATALANILNFANANLINADLYIGLVNIYGNWDGNIVFGYPDLAVSQASAQTQVPGGVNSPLSINTAFSNQGDGSAADAQIEWKFDPTLFSLITVLATSTNPTTGQQQSTSAYQTVAPGDIKVDLGELDPGQSGNANFQLQSLNDQTNGPADSFFADIFGNGPEINTDNNQNTLNVDPATGTPVTTNPGPTNPNNPPNNPPPPPPSSGGGGAPSGGGGGGSTGSAIGVASNVLRIYKSNSATGPVRPGNTIKFTITIDNDGNNELNNIVAYDNLQGPDGSTISSNTYDVPNMPSLGEYKLSYDLTISPTAEAGVYTNSAYAQGLNDSLKAVRTTFDGISSFTVINPNGQHGSGAGTFNSDNTTTPDSLDNQTGATSSPVSTINLIGQPAGLVLGVSCTQPAFTANLQLGSTNAGVKTLQVYLNKHGFVLAKTGAGSPGRETTFFGSISKAALVKFQNANHIKPSGALDTQTRTVINGLLDADGLPFCPAAPVTAKNTAPVKTAAVAIAPPAVSRITIKTPKKPLPPKPPVNNVADDAAIAQAPAIPVMTNINPVPAPAPAPKTGFWSGLAKHLGW